MPDLPALVKFLAAKANAPLVNRGALQQLFARPPKDLKQLPKFYKDHLVGLLKDKRKLRAAMTDVTPLSMVTNALTIPATLKLLKMYPHQRVATLAGAVGNVLGGQLMQRTGIIGGLLGGAGGEVLGRLLARPFSSAKRKLPGVLTERIQSVRAAQQHMDDVLDAVQQKLGADKRAAMEGAGGADGMTEHNPTTTDASIGGTPPAIQPHPGEQGRKSIAERGKAIGTGDNLLGEFIRLLGTGTVSSRRPGDVVGQNVDLDPLFTGQTAGSIP